MLTGWFLCLLIGLTLGLLGGGGSVLMVPVFVYVVGMQAGQAITLSLFVVAVTSLVGSLRYFAKGKVHVPLAALFIVCGSGGTWLGSHLTHFFSDQVLMILFGTLMLIIGLLLLLKKNTDETDGPLICQIRYLPAALTSFAVGIMTGFLGVGGGFMIVPALAMIMKCSIKTAIGTSLIVISINGFSGFASHAALGKAPLDTALYFSIPAGLGAILGSFFGDRFSARVLKQAFSMLILVVGLWVIFINFTT